VQAEEERRVVNDDVRKVEPGSKLKQREEKCSKENGRKGKKHKAQKEDWEEWHKEEMNSWIQKDKEVLVGPDAERSIKQRDDNTIPIISGI
jgi:hypothetical protein